MNRPTDKQIESVLAGIATPDDARIVAQWFATEEGSTYLSVSMDKVAGQIKKGLEELYVGHDISSEKMLLRINRHIRNVRIRRMAFRVAAVLIPFLLLAGIFVQLNSRVDLFGGNEYEEVCVAKGERIQMMFQDGTRVYINSDSRLRYPKKFGLTRREVFLQGEAYFVVAKNAARPFIVNLDSSSVQVLGTSFNIDAYPDNPLIEVCLDEGRIQMKLPSDKQYPLSPGDQLLYDRKSGQCVVRKSVDSQHISLWKQNVIAFNNASLTEVISVLNRWYNVSFEIEDSRVTNYSYTLTSENTLLEKVLRDLEKISPVRFEYDDVRREVKVKMKE